MSERIRPNLPEGSEFSARAHIGEKVPLPEDATRASLQAPQDTPAQLKANQVYAELAKVCSPSMEAKNQKMRHELVHGLIYEGYRRVVRQILEERQGTVRRDIESVAINKPRRTPRWSP